MKPIVFSDHALSYSERRGFSEAEVIETIQTGMWEPADLDRMPCRKEFAFENIWNGKRYAKKQIKPIFVEEETEIVVITIFVYYY